MNLMSATLPRVAAVLALALATGATHAQELAATEAARSTDYYTGFDAAPASDGATFYFIAIGPNGPTVFRVASTGGPLTVVAAGAPFVNPVSLTVSSDGRQIYVADRTAFVPGGQSGQVFAVPSTGGAPKAIAGLEGYGTRGIELNNEGGQDVLYFTGTNPNAGGAPGVYKFPLGSAGATVTTIAEGDPLTEPEGIAVSRSGDVYITDRGDQPLEGYVLKINGDGITGIVENVRMGTPAGIALSNDESRVLVSSLQPYNKRAQVLFINLATGDVSAMTEGIGQNTGAGGIHRAKQKEVYAWAGIDATRPKPPHGPIYKIMDK